MSIQRAARGTTKNRRQGNSNNNNESKTNPDDDDNNQTSTAIVPIDNMATVVETTTSPSTLSFHPSFSQIELHNIQESFAAFDIGGTGQIVVGELRQMLQSLQEDANTSEIPEQVMFPNLQRVLESLETYSDTDRMNLDEYIKLMESTTLQYRIAKAQEQHNDGNDNDTTDTAFAHVFELFDIDHKGYITVQDLQRIAKELGEHDMTKQELQEMIDRTNCKVPGQVRLEEFAKIMTMKLSVRVPSSSSSSSSRSKSKSSTTTKNNNNNNK